MSGTLYVVVNGRMVKASHAREFGGIMNIEKHDHKHGNRSASRYTRRELTNAQHIGKVNSRIARHVGRRAPAA